MAKSVSIPIALSELKRSSFRRLSSRKDKKKSVSTPLSGFVILVEKLGSNVKLYGTIGDCQNLAVGDEIIAINEREVSEKPYEQVIPYLQQCIRTKVIQLKVRRRNENETIEEVPTTSSQSPQFVDAYLVSVDREHIKEVTKRLKKDYPELRIYDMESIASEARKSTSSSLTVPNASQMNGEDKLRKYDNELRERENSKLQRQKENEFLRSSLRASTKLKALASNVEKQPASKTSTGSNNNDKPNGRIIAVGYENECFSDGGLSPAVATEKLQSSEAIPLQEVISSVERITSHLSEIEGTEENSKLLHDFFTSIHIQQAIQATADDKEREQRAVLHKPLTPAQRVRIAEVTISKATAAPDFTLNGNQNTLSNENSHGYSTLLSTASTSRVIDETLKRGGDAKNDDKTQDEELKLDQPRMKIVTIHKGEDSYLGATVKNEENRILIGRVIKGGIIEKTGIFDEGDELVEINDICLRGKQVAEVCDILRNLHGEVKFLVASSGNQKKKIPTNVLHLRALFDYDPEDDVYVPCKELAMKFQRGDILHVLNTSDENWWQAYRDGEDTTLHLAGLIPSSSFRQQVIIYMEEMEREGSKSGRKKERKKIPEMLKSLGRNGSKEIVKSADEDGIPHKIADFSDLLTYEEVALYLALTNKKRPILLCGPEGVGCLELRHRLLDSDKERMTGPVPYTSRPKRDGEINGSHYHFISRQQFNEDAKAGKFVEYGEYQKHLYGTAKEDIVNVIKKGKVCVMTVKVETLLAIRTADIMPFIVFIAPPSLHVLRRQKECAGQYNVKDEDLKTILIQGKQLEQKFGHFFDAIIVNTDFKRSFEQLQIIAKKLETEPQWVPATWLTSRIGLDSNQNLKK